MSDVSSTELAARAKSLLEAHSGPPILVLPNAWDVASARIFAASGARAIGTTSMGITATEGVAEGDEADWPMMLARIRKIAAAVDVPVTADVEKGYAAREGGIASTVDDLLDAGVVGMNVEDSVGPPGSPLSEANVLARRIAEARAAADARGVHLVINAKTDVFLADGPEAERIAAAVARGAEYRRAGADCLFVPGALTPEMIRTLVGELDSPLNVVANPAIGAEVPNVAELEALGVARVSVGSGILRATLAFAQRAATELLREGHYDAFGAELRRPGASASYARAIGMKPE
jgi:2-methylisocitrate lyase-like PEP mutase family enzyme